MTKSPGTSGPQFAGVDLGLLLFRVCVGGFLLLHGVGKIQHGVGGIASMLSSKGMPGFIAYGVYVGEIIAPLLVLLGYFTRPAAAVIAFNMVMAIMLAHHGDIFNLDDQSGGWAIELPMFYLLGAIALIFTGSGRLGVRSGRGPWD